jgi:hypothetical protein
VSTVVEVAVLNDHGRLVACLALGGFASFMACGSRTGLAGSATEPLEDAAPSADASGPSAVLFGG